MASRGRRLAQLLVPRRGAWRASGFAPRHNVSDQHLHEPFTFLGRPPLGSCSRGFHDYPVLASGNVSLETPAFCVWGANTGVGKTLVSAGLAQASRRRHTPMLYLKPVQTGFPDDSDAAFVVRLHTRAHAIWFHLNVSRASILDWADCPARV